MILFLVWLLINTINFFSFKKNLYPKKILSKEDSENKLKAELTGILLKRIFVEYCIRPIVKINDIKKGLKDDLPIDMLEIDLKNIWKLLGSIIGETYEDELIDQLFSQFCLGK